MDRRTSTDLRAGWPANSSDPPGERRAASRIRVGSVIRERYVLEERLGIGGKGTVFKALDSYRSDLPEEDRYVAIKILHPTAEKRDELVADLRHEFYCAQTLSHESIVNVYQLDRDADIDFFTMEFLEGELLSSVMERMHSTPMPRPQVWAIIRDIGSGLAHAHSRNVVHADLKPQNIMVTHSGEVRILDFSNAEGHYAEDTVHRKNKLSPGSLPYASCELLAGRAPDPRDDVYALACLSYELLAGEHPFQRRPATEARALGIVPKRPPGLTRQQWQTLLTGLSWHRAGRLMSIRAWLNKMNPERAATRRIPAVSGLQAAPVDHRVTVPLRATTMFVVLLVTVGVWVSFVRFTSSSRTGSTAALEAVINDPNQPDRPIPAPDSGAHAEAAAAPPPTAESAPRLSNSRARTANQPKQASAPERPRLVSAGNYTIHSGEHFAEIRVRRSSIRPTDTAFVWWTEAASAKPGIDYVHQSKVIQSFPKGKHSTSFFIKLVPKASRTHPEVFYVAIAEAGRNASADPVARAAVWLPMNHDQRQAAAEHDAHAESDTHAESDMHADPRFSTAALGSPIQSSK